MAFPTFVPNNAAKPAATILPPEPSFGLAEEVNHRVANSLQLLSAMISAALRDVGDRLAVDTLLATQHRIEAVAGVHRHLYRDCKANSLDLGTYAEDLAYQLQQGYGDPKAGRVISLTADAVPVTPEAATSIGIIISELVGNAFKYAYPDNVPGEVRVDLSRLPAGGFRLCVEDDGPGIDLEAAPSNTGLGSRLIGMMAKRIDAFHAWDSCPEGTRFLLVARS